MSQGFVEGCPRFAPGAKPPAWPVNPLIEIQARRADPAVPALESVLANWLDTARIGDAVIAASLQQRGVFRVCRDAGAELSFQPQRVVDTDIALPPGRVAGWRRRIRRGC